MVVSQLSAWSSSCLSDIVYGIVVIIITFVVVVIVAVVVFIVMISKADIVVIVGVAAVDVIVVVAISLSSSLTFSVGQRRHDCYKSSPSHL